MGRRIDTIKRYVQKGSSSLAFWWLPLFEGAGDYGLSKTNVCDYYLDFSEKAEYKGPFDEDGIIMLDYKGQVGIQYNPCAVAQYGLGLCSCYLKTKDETYKKKLIFQAEWLCRNLKIDEKGIGRLEYTFGMGDYKQITDTNYISAIAQGQAISFLLRAGLIAQREEFFKASASIYQCFRYKLSEGGVVNYDEIGRMYLEEAVTKKISCILDGFLYAMFGVYDYYLFFGDSEAYNIFRKCCNTIKERLPEFDLGFWSRADCYLDKPKMPASSFYHNVHVQQLRALYVITKEDIFSIYAEKWDGYQKNFWYRKLALLYKCWYKLFFY